MIRRRAGFLIWLLAAICSYFFENNTGTRILLAATVLLPAFTLVCAAVTARKIAIRLTTPEKLQRGETVQLHGDLAGGILLPGCYARLYLEISNPLVGDFSERVIHAGGKSVDFSLTADFCGQLLIRIGKAQIQDWFGLLSLYSPARDEKRIMVYPNLAAQDIPAWEADMPAFGTETGSPSVYSGDEPDVEIREYMPGDPIRQIHWKLSAKMDQLLIRENPAADGSAFFLMLETAGDHPQPQTMNIAVEGLLSFSAQLADDAISHSVCWYDHASEELRRIDVDNRRDFEKAEEMLLLSASAQRDDGIGKILADGYPYVRPDQVLLFSSRPYSDTPAYLPDCRITLMLPEQIAAQAEGRGMRIVALSGRDHDARRKSHA